MKLKIHPYRIYPSRLLLVMFGILLATLIFLYSCSGATIKENQRIALVKDQPYEGVQKTLDYTLEYRYRFQQKNPQALGIIELNGYLKPRRGLDTLNVYLNFLDSAGKIIGTKPIYAPGAGRGAGIASIEYRVETPPGTAAIAFTYTSYERRGKILPRR